MELLPQQPNMLKHTLALILLAGAALCPFSARAYAPVFPGTLVREVVASDGTVTTRDYTWGLDLAGLQSGTWDQESGGIGGLLAVTEVSGTSTNILLPISDHIGTVHSLVAAMTNSVALAQPAVVAEYDYAPYGQLISADGPLVGSCPFGFQSKYYDPETAASGISATATTTPRSASGSLPTPSARPAG
jgi:hypothetical protein